MQENANGMKRPRALGERGADMVRRSGVDGGDGVETHTRGIAGSDDRADLLPDRTPKVFIPRPRLAVSRMVTELTLVSVIQLFVQRPERHVSPSF